MRKILWQEATGGTHPVRPSDVRLVEGRRGCRAMCVRYRNTQTEAPEQQHKGDRQAEHINGRLGPGVLLMLRAHLQRRRMSAFRPLQMLSRENTALPGRSPAKLP